MGKPRRAAFLLSARCPPAAPFNVVQAAHAGCHIAHDADAPFVLSAAPYDAAEYDEGTTFPDLCCDALTGVLTLVNTTAARRVFYVSTSHDVVGRAGPLQAGSTRDDFGSLSKCTTLVCVLPPRTLLEAARLLVPPGEAPDIDSDVQELSPPSQTTPVATTSYGFPLAGGPFLCTQGAGGHFTHFFPGTQDALDFWCAVGTPVLSLAAGRVVQVKMEHSCSGVHVRRLFEWNSLMIAHDDGTFAEYVHLRSACVTVTVGDIVAVGTLLAESGDVGFSPEPHLHVQLALSDAADASTLPLSFRNSDGTAYIPVAGGMYCAGGPCQVS